MVMINVAKEFTETPGARYKTQGAFSGEEFRDNILYLRDILSLFISRFHCSNCIILKSFTLT